MTESGWLRSRPAVESDDAARLAQTHFDRTGEISELGSQQDRNYRIAASDGGGIMLKVNHPSMSAAEVGLQIEVSDRLRAGGVRTPQILPTRSGARTFDVDLGADGTAIGCAFELVDGASLADEGEMTGALAEQLGRLAAQTDLALADLANEAADRSLQWEMSHSLEVTLSLLEDLPEDRRALCREAAESAWATVQRVASDLPRQVIHDDLTSDNVMRDKNGQFWVIDIGDVVLSWRVAELAILAADVLGRTGSLAVVGRAVRGYHQVSPLGDAEFEALWPMVVLRGAVLGVSGWSQLRIDPGNDYARERIEHEWQVFARAVDIDSDTVAPQLRLAAGLPHRPGLGYHPVLAGGEAALIDAGVRSTHLDRGRWTDDGVEIQLVRQALAENPVAAFRFGETRLTRVSTDVSGRCAARARCVEVWSRPGSAVRAPFAGDLRLDAEGLYLTTAGFTLRFTGILPDTAEGGRIEAGTLLGVLAPAESGAGRLVITRFRAEVTPDAPFAYPDEEYETDGASDPSVVLGLPSVADPLLVAAVERQRRDQAMGSAAERYYREPPQIERGWGALLVDTCGRAYLDLVNNVTAIGHCHPRLADAVSRQLHLLNTNSRFLYEAYADFSERLLRHAPDPGLDTVIPVNSGSEAVDLALKLARVATGRRDVIALREAYHGWTAASDAVSTSAYDNPAALASRPDWVHLVDAPNSYRGPFRGSDSGPDYARQVEQLADQLDAEGRSAAAFISEPVLGNAGGVVPPEGYLRAVYQTIRESGGLAIADEIQVGYGRLGRAFFGCTMQDAVPDIITVAKAAGNAFPFGAVLTRRAIVEALQAEGMFFSSAAGAPASVVAGTAVLAVIADEGLQANAARVGEHLRRRLTELMARHPLIGFIHGEGLYLGIELVRDRTTLEPAGRETAVLCERMLDLGMIIQPTSERQNVLKVKPPLVLSTAEADLFVDALDAALTELGG